MEHVCKPDVLPIDAARIVQLEEDWAMVRAVDLRLDVCRSDPWHQAGGQKDIVEACTIVGRARIDERVPTGVHLLAMRVQGACDIHQDARARRQQRLEP